MFEVGRLQPGERVLIHAAGSGVGSTAVQMAHAIGATVLATARQERKLDLAKALGAQATLQSPNEDLESWLYQATQGAGVDVILDCLGASYWENHVRSLAVAGRLVLIGLMGGKEVSLDLGMILRKRLTVAGTVIRARALSDKRTMVRRFQERWLPAILGAKITPVLDKIFSWTEIQAAHHYLQSNQNLGKVVVRIP